MLTRRHFLPLAVASGLTGMNVRSQAAESERSAPEVCIYTEHFQELPIPEVCRVFQQIGVDGLDLTVRPGGHIEPQDAPEQLPRAQQTAQEHGLRIMMLTTGITGPEGHTEAILSTCGKLGIDRIKLGYFPAGRFGEMAERLDDVRRRLESIVELAMKYGVRPCVHVHSGATIPSGGYMLYELIRDMSPDCIGAYVDSHHMTLAGGTEGWRQAIDLLRPWISLVALKNFQWEPADRSDIGQQRWRTRYCRLEDGIAPIPDFVSTIHQSGYRGFYTLHTEYRVGVNDCIRLTTDDFVYLRKIFSSLPEG